MKPAVLRLTGLKAPLHLKVEDLKELFLCKLYLLIVIELEIKRDILNKF